MQKVIFFAQEYQSSGVFELHEYSFHGSMTSGWTIERDGSTWMTLPDGYRLVRTRYCGVCTTDLSRHMLPFPLPQVTGHEVVGFVVKEGEETKPISYFMSLRERGEIAAVAVEINASCCARGLPFSSSHCPYCAPPDVHGLNRQCPKRITLGIDRLPGGFAPYLLAPRDSIIPIPENLPLTTAALWEPFAAALHGVESTPNIETCSVAVLGPRKLGLMVIAALAMFKRQRATQADVSMSITAIARHKNILEFCRRLGAERTVNNSADSGEELGEYDVVFDTTGSASGFETALRIARKVLHLKSTSGSKVFGMENLTPMVIDEISLIPFSPSCASFRWHPEVPTHAKVINVYASPSVDSNILAKLVPPATVHQIPIDDAFKMITTEGHPAFSNSLLPRFDIAIVTTTAEADRVIRPRPESAFSLVRARGAIIFASGAPPAERNPLYDAIVDRGLEIRTSRCGDARQSLQFLSENSAFAKEMEDIFFAGQIMGLSKINAAFDLAKKSEKCIKVLIDTTS